MELFQKFNQIATNAVDREAVCDEESSLTYGKLFKRSNQIAHYLLSLGIKKGDRIGILAKRSPNFALAVLGILKSGASYVPLDLDYPIKRTLYMLKEAEVDILLVDTSAEHVLRVLSENKSVIKSVIFMDQNTSINYSHGWRVHQDRDWHSLSELDPQISIKVEDTIVVLFTSGSTGTPKGVELGYAGYLNNFANMQKLLELNENSRVAQMASPCFDISVTEMWMPLMYGATVCVAPKKTKKNPWALAEWIQRNHIDVIQFVPSLFQAFLYALEGESITFSKVKKLLFIGEALRTDLVKTWFTHFCEDHCQVYNLYGPVEASIEVSSYNVNVNTNLTSEFVPIGKPFSNTTFRIGEDLSNACSRGVLYLQGVQLAKRYLDAVQTENAFHEGFYCTGDIVEKLPTGDYLYVMRQDRQVKIRGYRVELNEIESVLRRHPHIRDVAVILREAGSSKRLIAFVLAEEGIPEGINQYIEKILPDYMVPHEIQQIQELPLNTNGKVNYNALSAALV